MIHEGLSGYDAGQRQADSIENDKDRGDGDGVLLCNWPSTGLSILYRIVGNKDSMGAIRN